MKPIILDEQTITNILEDIKERLSSQRNYNEVKYQYTPRTTRLPTDQKIKIIFTPLAWIKMYTLVERCATECAWHGIVTTNETRTEFTIHDIVTYPQKITAATVDIDDEEYEAWHQALNDEHYNNLRLQGHSHVNFGCTPSGTDTALYKEMLQALQADSFYIFMITNKKYQSWWNIYDLANNVIYDCNDIELSIENFNPEDWYTDQTKNFNKKSHTTPTHKGAFDNSVHTTQKRLDFHTETIIEDEYDAFYASDRYENYAARFDEKPKKKEEKKKHGSK